MARKLIHPRREEETALGNLFADVLAQRAGADVMFVGSGSIRGTELGPLVTLGDLMRVYPYDGLLFRVSMTGAQLARVFAYVMRPENRIVGESGCFQVNQGVEAVYNDTRRRLESLTINGQPVQDDGQYTVCLQEYHYKNSVQSLDMTTEELTAIEERKVVTTSAHDVLEEYLSNHQHLNSQVEGRLVYKGSA